MVSNGKVSLMANKPADRNNAEATPAKGIRKVNLADLQGSLSKRGRERFHDPELAQALREMLVDKSPFVWETAVVEGKNEKQLNASRAKWRSRAVSVFTSLNAPENVGISISWTDANEMVIIPKEVTA